jgi:hypothetical protein
MDVCRRMIAALCRLLTLLALVLMPVGMTYAPAAASPMPASHHEVTMGHCGEQTGQDEAPISKMACTAMCMALPATDAPTKASVLKATAPRNIGIAKRFVGMVPEIATPPPKQA